MAMTSVDDRTKLTLRNQVELLCFRVIPSGTRFSINVFKVRETVKYKTLTDLPETNEAICGLLTLRKEIIPIVDLKRWLYAGSALKARIDEEANTINPMDTQIIVCEFDNVTIGLWVYRADYIMRKNWEDIKVPVSSEFGAKTNNYTKNDSGDIVYIVDVEGMLSELFPMVAAKNREETEALQPMNLRKDVNVLIAEDSKSALKGLTNVLDKYRVTYISFENGRKLLNYIAEVGVEHTALIITDLEMPEASGFTVIKELKNNPRTAKIPIVVNTSMTAESNMELAKNLNAQGFIGKTNPKEVSRYLQMFLGK
ncbi:MAG: chemotaxis protein [Helicobacteraceae bacterium]|jgi:two-component system chemotaxis response regulator CheV|nr:chemotaxis protein [Helicobacteraceae bacterium]